MFGIDISYEGINFSIKNNPTAHFFKINLLTMDKEIPQVLYKKMDVAICTEVLDHLDDPILFLENAKKLLKKNGTIVITVPGGPRSAFDKYIGHRKHYTAEELKNVLENDGYCIENIYKAGFPFFNLYKMLIIIRVKRLISDVKTKEISLFAKMIARIFSILFKFNLLNSPWGWQLIAVAKLAE